MSKPEPRIVLADDLDQLNRAQDSNPVAVKPPLKPPAYGGPAREAIGSVVDNIVDDLCRKLGAIRETLDKIEQQALQSAARAKGALNEHVTVCIKLNDEISHMQAVVAEIKDQMEG
jgi:hypothetical protein